MVSSFARVACLLAIITSAVGRERAGRRVTPATGPDRATDHEPALPDYRGAPGRYRPVTARNAGRPVLTKMVKLRERRLAP